MSDWNEIEGNWNQLKGWIKQQFGELTDDDLQEIEGKREALVGKLQERYGISAEEAEKRIEGLQVDPNDLVLDAEVQGEGNYDASQRFQKAQHEFAAEQVDGEGAEEHIDGGKSHLSDADDYPIDLAEGEIETEVSEEEAERLRREQDEHNEKYSNR